MSFRRLSSRLIGLEASAGAHPWARELGNFGHAVRPMPPSHVKPYIRRGKTGLACARAICEAVTRPSMRVVPVKNTETQTLLMTHTAREFPFRQLTQVPNALRALLGEFGILWPTGEHTVGRLLADQVFEIRDRIGVLTKTIRREAARRLQTSRSPSPIWLEAMEPRWATLERRATRWLIKGPITATALAATLQDITGFRTSRDLSAWLGMTSRPQSSGGKERLGRSSKTGNRSLRRLLYLGTMGVITARRCGEPGNERVWQLLQRMTAKQAPPPMSLGPFALTCVALGETNGKTRVGPVEKRNQLRGGTRRLKPGDDPPPWTRW
ncbi:MAG: transposase [Pseudomonadota bacterium]